MRTNEEVPCRDPKYSPDDWFPHSDDKQRRPEPMSAREVKTRCFRDCPVYQECRDYALENGIPYGIWGGLSGRDRQWYWKQGGGRPTHFDRAMDSLLPQTNASAVGSAAQQERRAREREDREAS